MRTRQISPPPHDPQLRPVLYERFEREGIPLLLASGWAVCHHGYTRFANDIDWICSREHESQAIHVMESLGFRIAFKAMATRFKHAKHLDIPPVDLIWVNAQSFTIMADTHEKTGHHQEIPVINLETLLAMKIHALKDDEARQGKDQLDIRILLTENPNVITEQRLQELCERYGSPDAYKLIRPS